jgi:hypothetical protein
VLVPKDPGRWGLLDRLVADARAGRATRIFVVGRLFRFHAPTQILDRTGLYLQLRSSQDIRFDPSDGDGTPGGADSGPHANRRSEGAIMRKIVLTMPRAGHREATPT